MSQLRHFTPEFASLRIQLRIVTFDKDVLARRYVEKTNLPWPLLEDPQRQLYKTYGMPRGGWWAIYGLPSIWNYLKLIFGGQPPGIPGEDWRQLGGDVLFDPEGIVRFHHISTTPHDRPDIQQVLRLIRDQVAR